MNNKLKCIALGVSVIFFIGCGGGGGGNGANPSPKINKSPTVNAGEDTTTSVSSSITLTGIASDSDGLIVSYKWKKGSVVLGTSASLTYIPTASGTDTLTLTVMDDDGATASDSLNISIRGETNTAPTVNAGEDTTTSVNSSITLTGIASDSDGSIVSYKWKKGSVVLGTSASLTYTPTASGIDTLTLTVMDDDGATASDSVNISIRGETNTAPTVNAGADTTTSVNSSITLTGTASDSDGLIVSYKWKKGSVVLGTSALLTYTPTTSGIDTLTLTVTDDDGAIASDSLDITIYETKI